MGRAGSWAVRGGVVAAAVVVGAGWAAVVDDDGAPLTSAVPDGARVPSPTTSVPITAEEVVAAVEVEAGFTAGQVVACDSPAGRASGWYPSAGNCAPGDLAVIGDGVSVGIVVENTGDQLLLGVPVTYRFLAEDGTVVPEPRTAFSAGDLTTETYEIGQLWPGQRYAFGDMHYREGPGAARIEVEVGEPMDWMPELAGDVDHGAWRAGLVDVGDIEVGYGDADEPVVRFAARLADDRRDDQEEVVGAALNHPWAYAVYRDSTGRVIGGARASLDVTIGPDGPTTCEVPLDDPLVVPGIDPARVEVNLGGLS